MAEIQLFTGDGEAGLGGVSGRPVLLSARPPLGKVRTPSDICCIIDVSWSMSMEASVKAASGATESNGLSMLDIAKHAVRTVTSTLAPEDRLCVIQFCREAEIVLPLTVMDEAGKAKAGEVLDKMTFGSGTALFQGIGKGLDELQANRSQERLCHTMLLTDGETEDAAEIMDKLKESKARYGGALPGSLNTFGFGYEIDSPLLVKIASFCDGTYAFIPDAGFVGTIFVNAVSTLLATVSLDAVLKVEPASAVQQVLGGWELTDGAIHLGTLQYGQSKDVVVVVDAEAPPSLNVSLEYSVLGGRRFTVNAAPLGPSDALEVQAQLCRSLFVDTLVKLMPVAEADAASAKSLLTTLAEKVASLPAAEQDKVKGLLEDILGQCSEAVTKQEFWTRWGRHYAPSVMFAHKLQQCNNFKDPGVQFYGDDLFADIRDIADAAFNKLPAPQITPARYRYLGGGQLVHNRSFVDPARPTFSARSYAAPAAPAVDMAAYNDRCAG